MVYIFLYFSLKNPLRILYFAHLRTNCISSAQQPQVASGICVEHLRSRIIYKKLVGKQKKERYFPFTVSSYTFDFCTLCVFSYPKKFEKQIKALCFYHVCVCVCVCPLFYISGFKWGQFPVSPDNTPDSQQCLEIFRVHGMGKHQGCCYISCSVQHSTPSPPQQLRIFWSEMSIVLRLRNPVLHTCTKNKDLNVCQLLGIVKALGVQKGITHRPHTPVAHSLVREREI